MAIASFDKDVEGIQKLDDEPNDVQGLTPEELKQKFAQAAIWLKEYINTVLLPGITGWASAAMRQRAGACAALGPLHSALRPAVKAAILRKDAKSILSALQQ